MAHTYKIGDMVVPKIGPHKGHPHTVIHVHGSGEVNIKPHGLRAQQNKYRMGAAMAKPEHLAPHTMKESTTCPDCGCETCRCKLKMYEDSVVTEDYTAMKGKESFMKKKPVDVKYSPKWHVMSHGKTMERPTKEAADPSEREKLKHACWKGYEAIGVKTKDGVKVPNCVPVQEQTPAGGFGPDTAGVTSGGDVSSKTVSGSDTTPKGTRKKEILQNALKSAREKQKHGKSKEFEKDPEYSPLVVTQQ